MNVITIHSRNYQAPSSWSEVNEKQFIAWAAASVKKMDIGDSIRLFIKVMYGIPLLKYLRLPETYRVLIAPTISFLWDGKLPDRWIISSLKIGWRRYYGPDDRLSNCTINEFRFCLLYYQAYQKSKEGAEDYLDQLIATLYRPKRSGVIDYDIRSDLTDFGVRRRAPKMRSLPAKVRQAILLNFEGCYRTIRREYLDKLPKSSGTTDGLFDFNTVIRTVSGGKFGSKSLTEKTMLYDFLAHLVESAEEAERLKSRT